MRDQPDPRAQLALGALISGFLLCAGPAFWKLNIIEWSSLGWWSLASAAGLVFFLLLMGFKRG